MWRLEVVIVTRDSADLRDDRTPLLRAVDQLRLRISEVGVGAPADPRGERAPPLVAD